MNRLEKLKRLEEDLYGLMQRANSRSMAPLAKQYRETLREIEEIEGVDDGNDKIEEIFEKRAADGKPGAVRKSRSKVRKK